MGTYTPFEFPVPNGLDEVGLELGLGRLPGETLANYRQRLLFESRDAAGASWVETVNAVSRPVGGLDPVLMEIELALDANGDPIAPDPYFIISSTQITAYSDYSNLSLDFQLRMSRYSNWFVQDLVTALTASPFFNYTGLVSDYQYRYLNKLRMGHSHEVVTVSSLNRSYQNNLGYKYIKTFLPMSSLVFVNEKATQALVVAEGDYYVDYTNGTVFSYTLQEGSVQLHRRAFPFQVREATVRMMLVNDGDLSGRVQDFALNDDGNFEQSGLSSYGGWLLNQLYEAAPLGWGK